MLKILLARQHPHSCQTENKAKQNRAVRKHGCHGDSFFQGKKALEALTDM